MSNVSQTGHLRPFTIWTHQTTRRAHSVPYPNKAFLMPFPSAIKSVMSNLKLGFAHVPIERLLPLTRAIIVRNILQSALPAMTLLGLSPIPPELKSITPYLQRAEEVRNTDPAIAYWCAYYAAQLGITLKAKDHPSRTFLFELLDLLERMKAEIGQNDAIENNAASAAYVENFALRVFGIADNEDRRGNATRATAKKFLAAANFLEVLSTFDKPESDATTTIDVPEKIRYAKWKAADIAKAIREGRKPTPGGASEQQPSEESEAPYTTVVDQQAPPTAQEPPPSVPLPPSTPPLPPSTRAVTDAPTSPGAWSTTAAVGTSGGPALSGVPRRSAWVSSELEGRENDDGVDGESGKTVRFTPSTLGGFSPSSIERPLEDEGLLAEPSIPSAPFDQPGGVTKQDEEVESTGEHPQHGVHDLSQPFSPPTLPLLPPPVGYPSTPSAPSAPLAPPPTAPYFPNIPPSSPPARPAPPVHPPTQPNTSTSSVFPPPPILASPPSVASTITAAPEELSPQVIARVQKHCRFAISALDYEDVEQARKELRDALKMLGG